VGCGRGGDNACWRVAGGGGLREGELRSLGWGGATVDLEEEQCGWRLLKCGRLEGK
jgi:hypothetical protein